MGCQYPPFVGTIKKSAVIQTLKNWTPSEALYYVGYDGSGLKKT